MTVSEQLISIIIMILGGIFVGAVIDCTRTILHALSPKSFLRGISSGVELSVWALLGAGTFYILFLVKGGEWRLVDPLAQITGVFLYQSFLQPFFRFLGRVFIALFIKPIVFAFNLIITIIKTILILLFRIVMVVLKPFYKIYIILKKRVFLKTYAKIRANIFKKR